MRVLLVPFPGTSEIVGGHVTQQVETTRALRRLGVEASIASVEEALEAEADVVHAFGDIRPLLARRRPKARLVVSPIYVPRSVLLGPVRTQGGCRHVIEQRLRHVARSLRHASERRARHADLGAVHAAWSQADLVVVNSRAEGILLQRDASGLERLRVAYSGVAEEAFAGDPDAGRRLLGIGDDPFVLSVARVEPWKNQVSLALAVRSLGVRLVLVGAVNPGNERFLQRIHETLPDVVHVPHVDHGLLPHVYAAAAIHALPSWYETTGLSTLEALAAGRPVVVSRGPCVEEYFEGYARFCGPGNVRSIRRAIELALAGPIGNETECAMQFSWDRTARALLEAYETAGAA